MQGDRVGWKVARLSYWLLVAVGSVLLFAREQEFHILVVVVCAGLPVALIWLCCNAFRLACKRTASLFAEAKLTLPKIAVKYSATSSRLKVAGALLVVTALSFLYFGGFFDLNSVRGLQDALLAAP
jgi:hypothetical protein